MVRHNHLAVWDVDAAVGMALAPYVAQGGALGFRGAAALEVRVGDAATALLLQRHCPAHGLALLN